MGPSATCVRAGVRPPCRAAYPRPNGAVSRLLRAGSARLAPGWRACFPDGVSKRTVAWGWRLTKMPQPGAGPWTVLTHRAMPGVRTLVPGPWPLARGACCLRGSGVVRTNSTLSSVHAGAQLLPQKRLPCGSAAPVLTSPGRRRRPGPGRSTAGGRGVHSRGQAASIRQSPARKRGRCWAASR